MDLSLFVKSWSVRGSSVRENGLTAESAFGVLGSVCVSLVFVRAFVGQGRFSAGHLFGFAFLFFCEVAFEGRDEKATDVDILLPCFDFFFFHFSVEFRCPIPPFPATPGYVYARHVNHDVLLSKSPHKGYICNRTKDKLKTKTKSREERVVLSHSPSRVCHLITSFERFL